MTFRDPRVRGLAVTLKTVVTLVLAGVFAAGFGRDGVAGPIYTVGEGVSISNINTLTDVTDSGASNLVGFSNISNPNLKYAQGFTSTGTAGLEVTTIVLGLSANTPVSSAQVQIFNNTTVSGTAVPGSALATFTLTGTTAVFDTDTYAFTGSYTLAPSTDYWVVVSDTAAASNSSFNFVSVDTGNSPTGSWGYSWTAARRARDGVTWITSGAPTAGAIQVVAVPEPESLALLGLGTATVASGLLRRRRRSKG
jgi:hypothetical protein